MNTWQVRMISPNGTLSQHPGWLVVVDADLPSDEAINQIKNLGIDNGEDGEFAAYPEFTVDIIEWNNCIAELH